MDATHLHLMITHSLLFLAPVAVVLLLWGSNPLQKQMRRAGYVFALIAALGGWGAHFSGEETEEQIEAQPWADEAVIHEHEEAAEWTHFWVIALSAVALAGLFMGESEKLGKPLRWSVVIVALATTGAGMYTANLGGQIRHTEIRPEGAGAAASGAGSESSSASSDHSEHEDHD